MVVLSGVAAVGALTGGNGAFKGAITGASLGVGAAVSIGTVAGIGGATGAGSSAGAIVGSVSDKSVEGAVKGFATGAAASSGVSILGYVGTAGVAATGIGMLTVGTEHNSSGDKITYDCWKKVVHNKSEASSGGMLLKDLLSHPYVAGYVIEKEETSYLPRVMIENIWNEKFEIQYFCLKDSGKIVCHANQLTLM